MCFNQDKSITLYTSHNLSKSISARDTNNDRPQFDPEEYFGFDVESAYKRDKQTETIKKLTGKDSFVEAKGDVYLVRGHYSPNSDFVYHSFQVFSL